MVKLKHVKHLFVPPDGNELTSVAELPDEGGELFVSTGEPYCGGGGGGAGAMTASASTPIASPTPSTATTPSPPRASDGGRVEEVLDHGELDVVEGDRWEKRFEERDDDLLRPP